jgi:Ca-activated chloride channel family protein
MTAAFVRRAFTLLVLLLAALARGASATAADAPAPAPTVLIVDASGSMAARMPDGRAKLDDARDIVAGALQRWPAGTQLALMAYGHRRVSDCADIETLLPLEPLSPPQVAKKLATLYARGKTPLSESLRQAAALLPPGGGNIVLVSDGIETCHADPCAVAKALHDANANVVIYVVGFGVTKDDTAQLQCIAENGGGKYFDAGDADKLTTAMSDVTEEIKTAASEPPPPAPEPTPEPAPPPTPEAPAAETPPPPPSPVPVSLTAVAGALGIVDAATGWHVTVESGEVVYEGTSRALSLTLPPGRYHAKALAANAQGESDFTVAEDPAAPREFKVDVIAGRLDLALVANAKTEPFTGQDTTGLAWTLEPKEGQGAVEMPPIARPSLLLAPGRYVVRAKLKDMEAQGEAVIAPGKPTALTLDFRLGSVTLEAALAEDGPALDDPSQISWRLGEGDAAQEVGGGHEPAADPARRRLSGDAVAGGG